MHVPDNIKKAIINSSYDYRRAIENANKIRDWLESNEINSDFMKKYFYECIESGADNWRDFQEHLETHSKDQMYDGTDD
ncbi:MULTISPECIES: hypothetical protein [Bacillus amyloliquefaciens group]|uniref:hypothetical protein n=1 Tax=Bacillus amyloliquefaciens group TaxID=1938374 RepID=UPI00073C5C07|nr:MULTISPECIES: hypothetical protein [Bacillus amyloliquefaciens group]KTF59852.1 hypothetical protein AR691_14060 [Bacillus amyloliquefaciens]